MEKRDYDITYDAVNMVNENNYLRPIVEYISTFSPDIDIRKAKEMAIILLRQEGYTREEILKGYANNSIMNRLRFQRTMTKNVVSVNKPTAKIPLKTKKSRVNTKFVAGALAGILAISGLVNFVIKPAVEEIKENNEITQSIGMMAAEVGSEDYENKLSIIKQNEYHVPGQFDEGGHPIIAYHNDGIATDIIKVCIQNPELFDICMYNVYFDMQHNRLANMDTVFKYLKIYTANDESLEFINSRIANYEIFLEYLVNRGFVELNSDEYYKLLVDIGKYKSLRSSSDIPFNALSEESQERINNLIEIYESNKDNLYDEYKDKLENIEGENYGRQS